MSTAHTPGPWGLACDGCAIVGANGGTQIVETGKAYWSNLAAAAAQGSTLAQKHLPEVEANARLIAAAPELLATLETVVADATWNDEDTTSSLRERLDNLSEYAHTAIAKAKGTK
mgnify:CR=1 FL=1